MSRTRGAQLAQDENAVIYFGIGRLETLTHHPDTADTLESFAALREAQGNLREALSLYQRALEMRAHVSGPDHPKTLATRTHLCTLAVTLGLAGEEQDAENNSQQTIGKR